MDQIEAQFKQVDAHPAVKHHMNPLNWLFCLVFLITVSNVFASDTGIQGAHHVSEASSARVDVIKIDAMSGFGKLKKPAVEFLHYTHTQTLSKKNKNCRTCHLDENCGISLKFMRITDTDRTTVMNVYHQECISCHGEMKVSGEKSGPVECDGCHIEKPQYIIARQPMGFDQSLHFRHVKAQDKKCEVCHHEYDETAKKLFYAKGKEGTCRYCHESETKDNRISMRAASHMACINCHLKNQEKTPDIGPITCRGCHDASAQEKIKKMDAVPRLERNQPDHLMLENPQTTDVADVSKPNRMYSVPFDHKAHETYNDTCRICHHASLTPCIECHTLAGKKEADHVTLEKAMHQLNTEKSCKGCHHVRQQEKNCIGCHDFMGRGREEEGQCRKCHMPPVVNMDVETAVSSDPAQEKMIAEQMLRSRQPVTGTYPQADIPEKVIIKHLSKKFEAVEFPHQRIVNALVNNIKDSPLASYFHPGQATVCQGCHHHSPASKKPPYCGNCHGKSFDTEIPTKPGIIGAYHLQCMGCHKVMGMTKPAGCTDCHKRK